MTLQWYRQDQEAVLAVLARGERPDMATTHPRLRSPQAPRSSLSPASAPARIPVCCYLQRSSMKRRALTTASPCATVCPDIGARCR